MSSIEDIIVKSFLKRADASESRELEEWASRSERNRALVKYLTGYFTDHPVEEVDTDCLSRVRHIVMERISSFRCAGPTARGLRYWVPRVAAAIAAVLITSTFSIYIAYRAGLGFAPARLTVSTRAGQQSRAELPDGSVVWLNAETVLKYVENKERRIVTLDGEATFEVNKNALRPFVVQTGRADIKVTGTKFNVSNYPGTAITEVALISGEIQMQMPGWEEKLVVHPGEKITLTGDERKLIRARVNPNNSIAWQNGILIFENEPFDILIKRLERCYAIEVVYDAASFENIHYTGSLNNLSMEKVLEFIKLTVGIDYQIDNKTVFVERLRRSPNR